MAQTQTATNGRTAIPSMADLQAQIDKLTKENATLREKQAAPGKITFKVSEAKAATATQKATKGGGLSVYGLGRFPVTLYAASWQRLAKEMPNLLAFIDQNKDRLAWKE